ncbi:MAG: DMT family transporter [Coriobacteriia bacterium]|nr:DMT family transporter [Coriobacteriia bacterium]
MLTPVLAILTSLAFGTSDFLGGLASRRESPVTVTANAHALEIAMFVVVLLVAPAAYYSTADLAWGAVAGVVGGIGVVSLYAALAVGRMGVVAPITAGLAGSLPAVFDLSAGTHMGPRAVLGLVLAVVAVVVVSFAPGHEEDQGRSMPPRAVALSVLAGVCFASGFIALSYTAAASGYWPLLAARVTSTVMLFAVAALFHRRLVADVPARASVVGAGVFEALANVTMLTAIRIGPLAVAAILGSMFPIVVLLLARIFLGERLRWMQRGGVVLALLAVVLTALP